MNGSERSGARLFVSYSRKDRPFVDQLAQALSDGGHDVWFDLQDIRPSEEWLAAIHAAIERADAFVFVVSPDSVNPESVCAQEIDYATAHNKRIIPVVCRQVEPRLVQVPEAIGRLNWIFFMNAERFTESLGQLVSAIETDLEWVRSHTRLLERAVEWDAAKRDDSFVLQKNDLSGAERWLALGPAKEPTPTALQTEYIIESRAVATRRQRRLLVSGAIAALLVGIGITVAGYQYLQAEDRRTQALSRELAAESRFETDRTLDRAIPLSLLAVTARTLPESVDSAIAAGQASFGVVRFLRGHTGRVVGLCVVAGGRYLVSVGNDERVIVWDIAAGAPLRRLLPDLPDTGDAFTQVACSPSIPLVAIAPPTGNLTLWRIEADDVKLVADIEESDGSPEFPLRLF